MYQANCLQVSYGCRALGARGDGETCLTARAAASAETSLSRITAQNLLTNFQINAFGPILVGKVSRGARHDYDASEASTQPSNRFLPFHMERMLATDESPEKVLAACMHHQQPLCALLQAHYPQLSMCMLRHSGHFLPKPNLQSKSHHYPQIKLCTDFHSRFKKKYLFQASAI